MSTSTKWMPSAAVVLCGLLGAATSTEAAEPVSFENLVAPEPNSADEPLAREFSLEKAARILDSASLDWQRSWQCFTCHTNVSYLMARPRLSADAPAHREVRKYTEEVISLRWEEVGPRSDAEVVALGAGLALNDSATRRSSIRSRDRAGPDVDGATPGGTGSGRSAADGRRWSRTIITESRWPQSARCRARRLRKDAGRPGRSGEDSTLPEEQSTPRSAPQGDGPLGFHVCQRPDDRRRKKLCIKELVAAERPGGGWAFSRLYPWSAGDGKNRTSNRATDTARGSSSSCSAGPECRPMSRPSWGVAWLKTHQRASGRWYTRSLNKDNEHFISHAGSAFAVMALAACGEKLPSTSGAALRSRRQ